MRWVEQQRVPLLQDGEVHVWSASLEGSPAEVALHYQVLTAEERDRADRYRREADRVHFIQGRWLLRHLLSQYISQPAAELRLLAGPHGKPELDPAMGQISFNLSHSHGMGLFAFARGRQLGIDLEWIRPEGVTEDLIRTVFSPAEQQVLVALPPPERLQTFYRGWTRKEAYLKGRGDGLVFPLQRVAVSLHPTEPPRLLAVEGEMSETVRWTLADLPPIPGFAAALATEGEAPTKRYLLNPCHP
ncbi:MAG: 4'-phosphopantetheinyl transferase family protein [Mycobacterium leprae]